MQTISPNAEAGFASRRTLLEQGGAEFARAKRHERPMSVLALETATHGEREDLLVVEMMHTALRIGTDQTVQVENGRHVAILPETALSGALHLAARIQRGLAGYGVAARVGHATMKDEDERFVAVMARAQAMIERTG